MDCKHYTLGSILTLALVNFFSLKIEETYTFVNISCVEMSRNLEISSKCSVEAIKNTTLCKLPKVSKGFSPMGSNADLTMRICRLSLSCPRDEWL